MSHFRKTEHKPDMKNEFKKDQLLETLAKSAEPKPAPFLHEAILARASDQAPRVMGKLSDRLVDHRKGLAVALATSLIFAFTLGITTGSGSDKLQSIDPGSLTAGNAYGPDDTPGFGTAKWATDYYDFTASDGLSASPGMGETFRLTQDLTKGEVQARLSNALGVPVTTVVTTQRNSNSPVWFSYEDPNAVAQGPCLRWGTSKVPVDENGTEDPNGTNYRYCQTAAEAEDRTPSLAEAKAETIRIFESIGANINPNDVQVLSSGGGYLLIIAIQYAGEFRNPIRLMISWGNTGKIWSLYGLQARVENLGSYPVVSEIDAVKRASNPKYISGPVLSASARNGDLYQQGFKGLPMIKDVGKPNHQFKVVVTSTERVLAWQQDADGNNLLVPSYILKSEKGPVIAVQALEDPTTTK